MDKPRDFRTESMARMPRLYEHIDRVDLWVMAQEQIQPEIERLQRELDELKFCYNDLHGEYGKRSKQLDEMTSVIIATRKKNESLLAMHNEKMFERNKARAELDEAIGVIKFYAEEENGFEEWTGKENVYTKAREFLKKVGRE